MRILVVGLNHRTAPVEIREQLAFSPAMRRSALTHFDANHRQGHLEHVKEGVILSTCNRLELYTLVNNPQSAKSAILDFLSCSHGIPLERFADFLYTYHDEAAVQHLMRVACGLDSMVLGEPQILGQITEAFEAALSQQATGTVLSALFRAVIHTGKRARTETAIGLNPASVSSVAANLAGQLLGKLSQRQVLLIGAGEMGTIGVRALIKRGVSNIVVANRTIETAKQLATAWGGQAISFQKLPNALAGADIVISSTSAPHTILNRELLEPAMQTRLARPLFIIDIAVPRDVDPNVTEIPNVHLRDVDDLQEQADSNVTERQAEIPRVEAVIEEEVTQFVAWFSSLAAVPTITTLRQQVETMRQAELERLFNRVDLDDLQRELVATMSHRLVGKILHGPTIYLKNEMANGNGAAHIAAVRQMFSLDAASLDLNQRNSRGIR